MLESADSGTELAAFSAEYKIVCLLSLLNMFDILEPTGIVNGNWLTLAVGQRQIVQVGIGLQMFIFFFTNALETSS